MQALWVELGVFAALGAGCWGALGWWKKKAETLAPGRLKVSERLAIDARRQMCVVEVDGRRFLVGVGSDAMSLIAELGADKK